MIRTLVAYLSSSRLQELNVAECRIHLNYAIPVSKRCNDSRTSSSSSLKPVRQLFRSFSAPLPSGNVSVRGAQRCRTISFVITKQKIRAKYSDFGLFWSIDSQISLDLLAIGPKDEYSWSNLKRLSMKATVVTYTVICCTLNTNNSFAIYFVQVPTTLVIRIFFKYSSLFSL